MAGYRYIDVEAFRTAIAGNGWNWDKMAGFYRGNPPVADVPKLRSEADAASVRIDLPKVQDDGGGMLTWGGKYLTYEPYSREEQHLNFSATNGTAIKIDEPDEEIPVCTHKNGVERSSLCAGWICADCGDLRVTDGTVEQIIAMSGKGDTPRPVDKQEYDKSFVAVFGDKPKHVCRRFLKDRNGQSRCYHCDEPEPDAF